MLQLTVALDSEPVLLKHVHVGMLHEVVELLAAVDALDLGVEVTNRYVPTGDEDGVFELEWTVTLYDEPRTTPSARSDRARFTGSATS